MNCKFCNAELVEGKPFCPACGKNQMEEETVAEEVTEETTAVEETAPAEEVPVAEETSVETVETAEEAPKATKSPAKIATAVIAGVLVIALLAGMIIGTLGGATGATDPTIAPTSGLIEPEETVEVTIPSDGDPASVLCKESYTVSDEESAQLRDVVVATMDEVQLTNGELQAYYWMEVSMFLREYGSYAQFVGLDLYSPLDKQLTEGAEVPMSWQQYFLESAINSWKTYQSLALEAKEKGHELPAERQAELDGLPAELEESAKAAGMASVDELVKYNVGPGAKLEDYIKYVETYYRGIAYYTDYCDALAPTDEEIDAFFAENEAYYTENGITRDAKLVDVRHVLLQPEGGETGEDGYPVYTDEAWEACRVKVEEIYNKWQEGDKSEDSFAALANENTQDGNDANSDGVPDGGLYENVYEGQMVPEFEAWCFDAARQIGDHGLVKTAYGYHIMFFCDSRSRIKTDLIEDLAYDAIPAAREKHPATVDYSLIVLGEIEMG